MVSSPPLDVELLILPERLLPNAKETSELLILRYKEMMDEYEEREQRERLHGEDAIFPRL